MAVHTKAAAENGGMRMKGYGAQTQALHAGERGKRWRGLNRGMERKGRTERKGNVLGAPEARQGARVIGLEQQQGSKIRARQGLVGGVGDGG